MTTGILKFIGAGSTCYIIAIKCDFNNEMNFDQMMILVIELVVIKLEKWVLNKCDLTME